MSARYEYLEHTSDIRLKASGVSFIELIEACLKGMNNLLKPGFCDTHRQHRITKSIHLHANEPTILLVDFLAEVLNLSSIHKAVFCTCDILSLNNHEIEANVKGTPVDGFENDVKAVTYHEASIRADEYGNLETLIVFDL